MDGAALIMRAVAEGGASSAGPMREAALGEGAMLHHLAIACAGKVRAPAAPPSLLKPIHEERTMAVLKRPLIDAPIKFAELLIGSPIRARARS